MGVIQYPTQITGTVGINPNLRYMVSSDNFGTLTSPGYLNDTNKIDATPLSNSDIIFALYNYNTRTSSGTFGIFTVALSSVNGITLSAWVDSGNVLLPVVNNDIAVFNGTNGQIKDSGILYTDVMLKNVQNVLTSAGSIVANKVNGTEASNLVTANGMAGAITTSALTVVAGSNYVIVWTNSFITSTSFVDLQWSAGTNTVSNISMQCLPGNGGATITIYNNDPTAPLNGTLVLRYLVM